MFFAKDYRKVGRFLRQARLKAGFTQEDAAQYLGFKTTQFVSNLERGLCGPPPLVFRKLVKLYRLNPEAVIRLVIEQEERFLRKQLQPRGKRSS